MEMNGFISSWNNEFESYFKNGARFFPQIVSLKRLLLHEEFMLREIFPPYFRKLSPQLYNI